MPVVVGDVECSAACEDTTCQKGGGEDERFEGMHFGRCSVSTVLDTSCTEEKEI